MTYWVAMIDRRREELAVHYLQEIANYEVYVPRVREARNGHQRIVPLFPSYVFVAVAERGWWQARWSPGVVRLVLSGDTPALLSDAVVAELRAREHNGLIVLPAPAPTSPSFQPGDRVRITTGPLTGFSGLVAGMRPHQRVEVLLQLLGRVEMPAVDVALI
jgi:transcriptional antiterminator RfaH